jgi:hypothetical protein
MYKICMNIFYQVSGGHSIIFFENIIYYSSRLQSTAETGLQMQPRIYTKAVDRAINKNSAIQSQQPLKTGKAGHKIGKNEHLSSIQNCTKTAQPHNAVITDQHSSIEGPKTVPPPS